MKYISASAKQTFWNANEYFLLQMNAAKGRIHHLCSEF